MHSGLTTHAPQTGPIGKTRFYQGNNALFRKGWVAVLIILPLSLLGGCDFPQEFKLSGELTGKPGRLTVLTRNIPTAYYLGPDGETGFEYDLVKAFAEDLGLKLEIKVAGSASELLSGMAGEQADLAAGGLTRTPEREKRFVFGPDYFMVSQLVVYRRHERHPQNLAELQNYALSIPARSSAAEQLRELSQQWPGLNWQTTYDYNTDQLLEKIWRKELDCTIADSNLLAINRRYYPELEAAFTIGEKQPLAWIINPKRRALAKKLNHWMQDFVQSNRFKDLKERHFGHIEIFDYVDIKIFNRRIKTRLPRYRALFERYGHEYRIPWTLLAAKAYQESHWDPLAQSPTGVRGIMMLTLTTADQMGVTNRLAAEESIRGGAAYLRSLLDQIPAEFREDERANVAMAAYNIGMGHIHDVRRLARAAGENPNQWSTLEKFLPLLRQEKYYKALKHGYARGDEPIMYVKRINNYRHILEKKLGLYTPPDTATTGPPLARK
ncbi:MAG TPA: membrane-bound lytic murein transglycosylase MltF [Proteobacteria bacterium]|mgnify:CR=1 FL=1|nr:membrane-bound lytic murein transglycosylase MltF [Pseudomonadota bacterium]